MKYKNSYLDDGKAKNNVDWWPKTWFNFVYYFALICFLSSSPTVVVMSQNREKVKYQYFVYIDVMLNYQ